MIIYENATKEYNDVPVVDTSFSPSMRENEWYFSDRRDAANIISQNNQMIDENEQQQRLSRWLE